MSPESFYYFGVVLFTKHKEPQSSDEALIQRFRKGNDLEVLGVLYNRYIHLVYGVCLKYLKNREDSQDAVMQIFEVLIKEVPKHEIRVFKSWLHGVTRNFCLMQLRSATNKKTKELISFEERFMENASELHPINIEPSIDTSKALVECLEGLKQEQKKGVELFYYEQQCYREIAETMQVDEKKVKSFIQNGKRNLKNCLEQKEKSSRA